MKKIKIKMHKPVYLGLSILEISKTQMYEFWYDYIKPKYRYKAKWCYTDKDNFIVHIKTEDDYKDIANDVEKRFDKSNYEINRPLPKVKIKSNWINERWIRRKDYDRICTAETKNIFLFNKWW